MILVSASTSCFSLADPMREVPCVGYTHLAREIPVTIVYVKWPRVFLSVNDRIDLWLH